MLLRFSRVRMLCPRVRIVVSYATIYTANLYANYVCYGVLLCFSRVRMLCPRVRIVVSYATIYTANLYFLYATVCYCVSPEFVCCAPVFALSYRMLQFMLQIHLGCSLHEERPHRSCKFCWTAAHEGREWGNFCIHGKQVRVYICLSFAACTNCQCTHNYYRRAAAFDVVELVSASMADCASSVWIAAG